MRRRAYSKSKWKWRAIEILNIVLVCKLTNS